MDFLKKNWVLILGALILAGAFYLTSNPPKPGQPQVPSATESAQTFSFSVEQKISYSGVKEDEILTVNAVAGENALNILTKMKSVETKEAGGLGKFVEGIEGVKADSNKNYWALYVNGQLSPVGAEQYQVKQADKIEWRLEKI